MSDTKENFDLDETTDVMLMHMVFKYKHAVFVLYNSLLLKNVLCSAAVVQSLVCMVNIVLISPTAFINSACSVDCFSASMSSSLGKKDKTTMLIPVNPSVTDCMHLSKLRLNWRMEDRKVKEAVGITQVIA